MSLFDRLFRRGRGGAGSARPGTTDAGTPTYATPTPVHTNPGGGDDADRGDRGDAGRPGGDSIEPAAQEIQVGEASAPDQGARSDGEPASQEVDVGDSGGGGDSGGDGGDGGGGGGE